MNLFCLVLKWLLGTYDVRSPVSCLARHWISRTDPKKTCRLRLNMHVVVPIVFRDLSDFRRHDTDFIPKVECLSLFVTSLSQNSSPSRKSITTDEVHSSENYYCLGRLYLLGRLYRFGIHNQSHHISATPIYPKRSHRSVIHPSGEIQFIRRQSNSMTRNPTHAQPFSDSGACNFGTSQPSHNQKIQASDSNYSEVRTPLLEGVAPSAVFLFRSFSAAWKFHNFSLHCGLEVSDLPQVSIADASVKEISRSHKSEACAADNSFLLGLSYIPHIPKHLGGDCKNRNDRNVLHLNVI
ncbi:hypothetical protein LXL04_006867 [Taraxacum kok-saghyz]